jgi:hypothetical protein
MGRRQRIEGHPLNSWHVYVTDRTRKVIEELAEKHHDGSVGVCLDHLLGGKRHGGWN